MANLQSRIVRVSAAQNVLTNGGKMQFPLDPVLPQGYRVDHLMLCGDLTVTAPAGGVSAEQSTALVDRIECDRRLQTSGLGMSANDWLVNGKDATRPVALTVGAGQAVKWFWPVSFRDPRSVEPSDSAVATAFYRGRALDVVVKDPNTITAGFLVTAGSMYLVAFLSPLPEGTIPSSIVQGYAEVTGKQTEISVRGRLVDLFIVKNDGAAITDAEVGTVKLTRDSVENLLEDATAPILARSFNYFVAKGAQVQGAADGVEGESLPSDTSYPFVPVFHPVAPFKATKLPSADDKWTLTITGTLAANTARVFYRVIEEATEEQTLKAAAKLGYAVDADKVIAGKTFSKAGFPDGAGAAFRKTYGVIARRIRARR